LEIQLSILSAITNTPLKEGIKAVISGVEGVGKTTLAVNAPQALLVPMEQGYAGVIVNKVPLLADYHHVIQLLNEVVGQVQAGQFPYKTLVFDSATALERLIHTAVLKTDPTYQEGNKKAMTMESALGGYGKAYTHANQLFADFLAPCEWLASAGINIILTCHVFASTIQDPTVGEYQSWDLLLHSPKNNKTYGKREMLTQWADLIGYLHEPLFVIEGAKMNKGVSANKGRVLAISRTPSYVAKNRFNLTADIPMPQEAGWNHLANAIFTAKGIDFFNRD
jgi:hypothetical protein